MLASRDNKHNIVEKLLELGAVVTDKDKVNVYTSVYQRRLIETSPFIYIYVNLSLNRSKLNPH